MARPRIVVHRSLWGVWDFKADSLDAALVDSARRGYDGVDTNPVMFKDGAQVAERLVELGLVLQPRLWTFGNTMEEHIDWVRRGVEAALPFNPPWLIVQGGRDAWDDATADVFFDACTKIEAEFGVTLAQETHRSRILFHPWRVGGVLDRHPSMYLAADYSHWVVVAERYLDSEADILQRCAPRVLHFDARVGHPEGPQVPDPREPQWATALEAHETWWRQIIDAAEAEGRDLVTAAPEFGPEPYRSPGAPPSDDINDWMAQRIRSTYS